MKGLLTRDALISTKNNLWTLGGNKTKDNGRYGMQNKISINYTKTGYDVVILCNGVVQKFRNLSIDDHVPSLRISGGAVRIGDLLAREVVDDKN